MNFNEAKQLLNKNGYRVLKENQYTVQPEIKAELTEIIKKTIAEQGDKCDLNFIDTRLITDMSYVFYKLNFNGDISKWDVSNVTNMECMFALSRFDGDISNWDISKVTFMEDMFMYSNFTGDISNWIPAMKKNNINITEIGLDFKDNDLSDLDLD